MNDTAAPAHWKVCSICKQALSFSQNYFQCSVSTCQRKRTGLFFCSLACFEAHLPTARHRDAWAEEETAPSQESWQLEQQSMQEETAKKESTSRSDGSSPRRVIAGSTSETSNDVLVVVSKLKKFVREVSGMNTSDTAIGPLSNHLRDVCRRAVHAAERDGRRTLLDRDILAALRGD